MSARENSGDFSPNQPLPDDVAEADLVNAAQADDIESLVLLFSRSKTRVVDSIQRRLTPIERQRTDAEDIWQVVVTASMENLATFEYRGEGSFCAWLMGIARLKVSEFREYRHAKKRSGGHHVLNLSMLGSTSAVHVLEQLCSLEESPDSLLEFRDEVEQIRLAAAQLNPDDRQIIEWVLAGKTTKEIADSVKVTPGAVRARIHRATQTLRTMLLGAAYD